MSAQHSKWTSQNVCFNFAKGMESIYNLIINQEPQNNITTFQ